MNQQQDSMRFFTGLLVALSFSATIIWVTYQIGASSGMKRLVEHMAQYHSTGN